MKYKYITEKLKDLYYQGKTQIEIAKELNVDRTSVIAWFKRIGLRRTSQESLLMRSKKIMKNSDFFDEINTEEKAYWIGFLYADGCVRASPRNHRLRLKLKYIDQHHDNATVWLERKKEIYEKIKEYRRVLLLAS